MSCRVCPPMCVCICASVPACLPVSVFAHTCACPCARPRPRPAPPRAAAPLPPGGRGGRGRAGPSRAGTQVGAGAGGPAGCGGGRGVSRDGVSALPSGGCPCWCRGTRRGVRVSSGTGGLASGLPRGVSRAGSARVGTQGPWCCRCCRPPPGLPCRPSPSHAGPCPGVCPGRLASEGRREPQCPGTVLAGSSRRGCQSPAGPAPHPGASVNAISGDRLRAGTPSSRTRHCAQPGPVRCPLPAPGSPPPASLEGAALPAGAPVHAMDM